MFVYSKRNMFYTEIPTCKGWFFSSKIQCRKYVGIVVSNLQFSTNRRVEGQNFKNSEPQAPKKSRGILWAKKWKNCAIM